MTQVDTPFSTLKDLHEAFLDPLNPFGGDFKSAPAPEPELNSGQTAENDPMIFFDFKGETYLEAESYEQELMLPSRIREIYDEILLSQVMMGLSNLYFLTEKNGYLLLQLRQPGQ